MSSTENSLKPADCSDPLAAPSFLIKCLNKSCMDCHLKFSTGILHPLRRNVNYDLIFHPAQSLGQKFNLCLELEHVLLYATIMGNLGSIYISC